MDDYRRAYLMRLWAAAFADVPFAALMVTSWPDWPWWIHSIGALVIWSASTYIVFKLWALPDPSTLLISAQRVRLVSL